MGRKWKTIKKNQIKISKKCKDFNKLKHLKINDELKKHLQKDYSTKRSTCDRILNKLKVIQKPTLKKQLKQKGIYIFLSNYNLNSFIQSFSM